MSTTELATRTNGTGMDVMSLGRVLAQSGYFKDAREMAQAAVKVMAGGEMGFGPVASMLGIYFFEGKVTISAGLMASAIRGSAKYDYRVRTLDNSECAIEFFQGSESLGVSGFTLEDARAANLAGKPVWKQYPKNMLFARALSNGVRWYCPDVFQATVYTPEEMGAEVDGEGNAVIVAQPAALDQEPSQRDLQRFWIRMGELGVAHDDVHRILGVQSSKELRGDLVDAEARVRAALDTLAEAEAVEDQEAVDDSGVGPDPLVADAEATVRRLQQSGQDGASDAAALATVTGMDLRRLGKALADVGLDTPQDRQAFVLAVFGIAADKLAACQSDAVLAWSKQDTARSDAGKVLAVYGGHQPVAEL